MSAPDSIKELVDTFANHKEHYKSGKYNETQLRREFLDPFFRTLGWDIDNRKGYADAYKDVIHEDAIKIGANTRAPDYCFRIGGNRKFFLEAKRPSVNIKSDGAPAYQLRRYAWSAKLPISLLSDFEEFSVYDCRVRPKKTDPASKARTIYMTFDQYVDRWSEIEEIFSREAVLRGAFDKYSADTKKKKGTSEVDDEFLEEIENWRELLAKNFALRNPQLSVRDLNYSVQKTIDRLVFLRICEDRGTEDYGRLKKLQGKRNSYSQLVKLFREADDRYNSGLFHFNEEKGHFCAPDSLTTNLNLDDQILDKIIRNLYYPDSPYEFSVLPASILGQVYEQFLGKTIRLTKSHQAKIEDKPEVRKSGGVYYTPKYVVDYMVQQTIGRLLNNGELTDTKPISVSQAARLKIVDPACGSGSFLIEAFQYLLDWHRDQYTFDQKTGILDAGKISRHSSGKAPKIYEAGDGDYRLTTSEKKRILLNNIYGVDIDPQAVEVTKLSLLLKVLEGDTSQNIQRDFITAGERILPDLGQNILCGNSILEHDFYERPDLPDLNLEDRFKLNTFSWSDAFPHVFDGGGFDCVIGNPPYVDLKDHPPIEVEYIFNKYSCANNRINLFSTFLERAISLVKDKGGCVSFIVPTSILAQSSYTALRKTILSSTRVQDLARLPNESFGSAAGEVKVDTVIITLETPTKKNYQYSIIAYRGYERISEINESNAHVSGTQNSVFLSNNVENSWSVSLTEEQAQILKKMDTVGEPLGGLVQISLGLTPYDKYKGHTPEQIKSKAFHADFQKESTYKKLLKGNDVRRYQVTWNGKTWINYGPWLGAPRDPRFFTQPRIIVKQIIDWSSLRIWAAYTEEELYNTQNAFNILAKSDLDLFYILGLLNSRLINFYHTKRFLDEFKMRFQKILIQDCKKIPIPSNTKKSKEFQPNYDAIIESVKRMIEATSRLTEEKNPDGVRLLRAQIQQLDKKIDSLVYDSYSLSPEDVEIVEAHYRI